MKLGVPDHWNKFDMATCHSFVLSWSMTFVQIVHTLRTSADKTKPNFNSKKLEHNLEVPIAI